MIPIIRLLIAVACLGIGIVLGYFIRQISAKKKAESAEQIINKAKEKSSEIVEKAKQEEAKRRDQILRLENRLERKEEDLENRNSGLRKKVTQVKNIKKDIDSLREKQTQTLEKISGFSKSKAQEKLFEQIEQENAQELEQKLKRLETDAREELDKKAKNLMALAMQRYASSQATELTTTTVALPNDELKGRVIGKEGRNIHALEQLTGVEIVVDDTPGAITISGFNPIRRQIAKMTLEKLLADGRIHPARIEEAIEVSEKEIAEKIKEAGQAAAYEVGVPGLDPKLVQLLGRLMFRTSYGQNVLLHSIEVAHLSAALATELGADVALIKKAGLLHDIGKSVDREIEGTHVEIGKKILQKFNISEKAIIAMQSHHEEYPAESIEGMIIQAADALSASRPGARKDTVENYLKRLEELEKVALNFEGVEKSYAIQAGREIRVFVKPEQIDDLTANRLARKIAKRIQEELEYPGEIKVNVIRETRSIEYAK